MKTAGLLLGGTGAAKVAGNYAASLLSLVKAKDLGFHQNMWLDATHKRYIEELSGMNIFAMIDGALHTPKLTDTILPGVTRGSIVELAKQAGYKMIEESMDIDKLIGAISSGRCTEMFACGTAAVVTPIAELGERDGTAYCLAENNGPVTRYFYEQLHGIQRQRAEDVNNWVWQIEAS